jgi:hypothetical protein
MLQDYITLVINESFFVTEDTFEMRPVTETNTSKGRICSCVYVCFQAEHVLKLPHSKSS